MSLWAPAKSCGQLEQIAQAALIEADPEAAEEAARDAELSQGVWVGQSTDHGIRDVHIRTDAASAAWFDARSTGSPTARLSCGQPLRRGGTDADAGLGADRVGHVNWLDLREDASGARSPQFDPRDGRTCRHQRRAAAWTTTPGARAGRAAASGDFAPIRQGGILRTRCVGWIEAKLDTL